MKSSPYLFTFSLFLSAAILVLILAGGLVTSHEAGLAVPDWPLSYGQLMPPMVGNVFWEHGHRMIAGAVGMLTLVLAVWIQKQETRRWMKKLGWAALGAVLFQALLGGLTVKMMLPDPVSIFHACLAQTFFCLVICISYFLSPAFINPKPLPQVFSKPALFFLTAGFVYLQLILGALVRHTNQHVIYHIVNAVFVLIHGMLSCGRIRRLYSADSLMSKAGSALGLFLLIQLFLGAGSFIFKFVMERSYAPSKAAVFVTAAHQTTGAVILGLCVFICLRAVRR